MNDYIVSKKEYLGRPVIEIYRSNEDRFPIRFGLAKAKKILSAIDEIKKFVEEESAKAAAKETTKTKSVPVK